MKKRKSIRGMISGLEPEESVVFKGGDYRLSSIRNTASSVSAETRKNRMFSVSISYEKNLIRVTRSK
jgi:hypothetical protein